jgi:hypothetical protein
MAIGGIDFDERDMLMETQGDVFYITDHYRNSRYVLMRLSKADRGTVEAFLRRRWFAVAPKKLHAAFGQAQTAAKRQPRAKKRQSIAKKTAQKARR